MTVEYILIWLLIGAVAGWLASQIVRGGSSGLVANIIIGIVGAFLGGWLLRELGVSVAAGLLGVILSATIGAIVLLLLVHAVRRV